MTVEKKPLTTVDLSSTFAAPDRTASLRNVGLQRPKPSNQPADIEPVNTPNVPASAKTDDVVATPVAKERRTRSSEAKNNTVVVYLSLPLCERLQLARQSTGKTQTDIVLDAVESAYERLNDILTGKHTSEAENGGVGLFRRLPRESHTPIPKRQITIRPLADQLSIIDGLVAKYGAQDRSFFLSAVLDAELPHRQGRKKQADG